MSNDINISIRLGDERTYENMNTFLQSLVAVFGDEGLAGLFLQESYWLVFELAKHNLGGFETDESCYRVPGRPELTSDERVSRNLPLLKEAIVVAMGEIGHAFYEEHYWALYTLASLGVIGLEADIIQSAEDYAHEYEASREPLSSCLYADDTREQAFQDGIDILSREEKREIFMPGWPQYRIWSEQGNRKAQARRAQTDLQQRLAKYKAEKAQAKLYSDCEYCFGSGLSYGQSCHACGGNGWYKRNNA